MTSEAVRGRRRRLRGCAKSQFIEWEEDSDECEEDRECAAPMAAATTATSSACSSPLFNSSFLMCSPVMNSGGSQQPQSSQSPVHYSQFKAVATLRRTNSKRPHREEQISFNFFRYMYHFSITDVYI